MEIIQPTKRLRLKVEWIKKASAKKFGDRVYQVFRDTGRLLVSQGWDAVKTTRQYAFVRLPDGVSKQPPFFVDALVPTRDEVMRMASEAHGEGKEWTGWIGAWASGYIPAHKYTMHLMDDATGRPVPGQDRTSNIEAQFVVGAMCLIWNAGVSWSDDVPTYHEKTENIVVADLFTPSLDSEFYEGALRRIEVNQYERDPVARSQCIAHHGATCVACGFDFQRIYGDAASGFIHVHHLVRISDRGGTYKVDPINDLAPVCPNCHAVIHLREPPYSLDEVRAFIVDGSSK